jgi:hypothetical protein
MEGNAHMEMTDTRIVKSILTVGVLHVHVLAGSGSSASLGETMSHNPDATLQQAVKISERLFALLFPAADEAR